MFKPIRSAATVLFTTLPLLAQPTPSATSPTTAPALVPGLLMDVYELPRMPTRLRRLIPGARPAVSKVVTSLHLADKAAFGGHDEQFQMLLAGFIRIERAGTYGFRLNTDDGSELRVDGTQVILNEGVHGQNPGVSGTIDLTPGLHPVLVRYFQADYGFGFNLTWQPPGADDFAAIPAGVLRTDPSKIRPRASTMPATTRAAVDDLDAVAYHVCTSPGFGELNEKTGDLLIALLDSPNQISQRARRAAGKMLADVNYDGLSKENQGRFLKGFLQSTFGFQTERVFKGTRAPFDMGHPVARPLHFWNGRRADGYRTTVKIDGRDLLIDATTADAPEVEIAAKAVAGLPDFLRTYVLHVIIDPGPANQYNGGGDTIWIRLSRTPPQNQVDSTFAHEIGHVLASHTDADKGWQDVVEAEYVSVSGYGNRNLNEDFAEFTRLYFSVKDDVDALESVKTLFPKRYAAFMTAWDAAKSQYAATTRPSTPPQDRTGKTR